MSPQAEGLTAPEIGRYAPSPTGRLHIGNARTALLSWWSIRSRGGRYVMRVEDLDRGRCRPEFEAACLEDLRWLGLDWDEGPDVGGPNGPYRQSECTEIYDAALAQLDTYPCYCSRREIREAVSAPHGATPVYPGTCADGREAVEGRVPAIRVRVPERTLGFEDHLAGAFAQRLASEVGDFILRRSDGVHAYQLAVVVDDARMGVTEVYRGIDLLDSTPRQLFLQEQLDLPQPQHAHAPLLLGPDGVKLNKRHRAPDLGHLREAGVDPREVVTELARSVGMVASEDAERYSASALIEAYAHSTVRAHARSEALQIPDSWPRPPA